MPEQDFETRLSRITTNWTQLLATRQSQSDETLDAQSALLSQYSSAVYRYLLAAVHDEHVADDLAQEFAVRFLRGDFRSADPARGRFRDFLKQSLRNLVTDHFRRLKSERQSLNQMSAAAMQTSALDACFDDNWTQELLQRTWSALDQACESGTSDYYIVLRQRAEHPELSMDALAASLSVQLNNSDLNTAAVRQTLHRARKKFGELLRAEIRRTIPDPSESAVEQELAELQLLQYGV